MGKRAEEQKAEAVPIVDGEQLLLDLTEVRERFGRLTEALGRIDLAEDNVKTLERQLRAARKTLLEAKMSARVIASGERRRAQKGR